MDRLPDELINHILAHLDVDDIVSLQQISSRFLKLGRDCTLWKVLCFDSSPTEAARRLRGLREKGLHAVGVNARRPDGLLSLVEALDAYQHDEDGAQISAAQAASLRLSRALANWEPGYPGENLDYYEEYIQRHAKINVNWMQFPGAKGDDNIRAAIGAATYGTTESSLKHVICPMDDGSVIIYDSASASRTDNIVGHSGPGLLTPGAKSADDIHRIMTSSSSVEVVSIHSASSRGYFAVGNLLHEVDLNRLSLVSSKQYSLSAIAALSNCDSDLSLMVGTNESIHLYDARDQSSSWCHTSARTELIAGPAPRPAGHITLTQPGPTSIQHDPFRNDSIWIAGRFTSMLQYSLRFFPRLESTLHSGARISCMMSSPYTYVPRHLDLLDDPSLSPSAHAARKSGAGWTAICAGVYKGKGSLELYSMSATTSAYDGEKYMNRQTASSSKLLSVAPHGGKIVCSDGNGNLRWMERNGYSLVRSFNINEQQTKGIKTEPATSQLWTNADEAHGQGDIVQKVLPFSVDLPSRHTSEKLLLWTADGRVGTLSFGPVDTAQADEFHDAVEMQGESTSERARHDAERQYALAMRRALKRNADEVRFVKGLGLGYR